MEASDQDIAALIELLRMAADQWRHPGENSQSELFEQDKMLLQMWPEACRRTGAGTRQFPSEVIKLWKQEAGRTN